MRDRATFEDRARGARFGGGSFRSVLLVAGLAVLAASGCRGLWIEERPTVAPVAVRTWPPPPDPMRIEFVAMFRRASDLGIRPSFWTKLGNLLVGRSDPGMIRPTDVDAAEGRVVVADAGSGLVHVFDAPAGRSWTIEECGTRALAQPVSVAVLGTKLYVADSAASRIEVFDRLGEGPCAGGWQLGPDERPADIAADPVRRRLYVADARGHRVLAFDPDGGRLLQWGERGERPGTFNYPAWLALDRDGNVYVVDSLNFRVQVFDPNGQLLTSFGQQGDGSGDLARPKGIGVHADGTVYLVDALFGVVQMFDRAGAYLMAFGAPAGDPAQFWLPAGLAVDGERIYVADSYNGRVQVFRTVGGRQ